MSDDHPPYWWHELDDGLPRRTSYTVQLTFRTSIRGKRYALYRVKGHANTVWHGIGCKVADDALRLGSIQVGRMAGALVELVEAK